MRELTVTKKDISRIAFHTSRVYHAATQHRLTDNSRAAIQFIIARDYIAQILSNRGKPFDPSHQPVLNDYLKLLSQTCSDDQASHEKMSSLAIQALFDIARKDINSENLDQNIAFKEESYDDTDSELSMLQVFDRIHFQTVCEKSSLFDKETRRILKALDEDDDGMRQLQRITPEIALRIENLKQKYPNMLPFLDYVEKHAALSCYQMHKEFYMPPVLLVSAPGIGKTACVKEVAQIIGLPFELADFATLSANFVLTGSSSSWASAKPGLIFDMLIKRSNSANGMILCDEIDKAPGEEKYPVLNVFYRLLEKDIMRRYSDEFIPQMPLDASRIMFVATANDISQLNEAILSRFFVIHIASPNQAQLRIIAQSIYESIIAQESYQKFDPTLNDDVIDRLMRLSPRQIKVSLKLAFANRLVKNPESPAIQGLWLHE